MKLYGKQDLRFEETDPPVIENADDVIIKVKAAGICGSDISRYKKLGPYVEGMVFGHEFSGKVVDTGEKVQHVKRGDRVAGCPTLYCGECESCRSGELAQCAKLHVIGAYQPGAYAEYVKLPAENVIPIPDNVDFDTASMVEPSSVVVHGLYRTKIQPGAEVAVMGCGNIGLLAIQWAKVFGASTVYAIDIDEEKLEIARAVGADVRVNPKEKAASEQIFEMTNGRGVDVAIESAGSPVTSAQVLALSKKGGEVLFLGIPYADVRIERFYFEKIVRNELTVLGSWNAISAPFPGKEWRTSIHYMSIGKINVERMISHRLPLREGPVVFDRLVEGNGHYRKVLLYPEE